MADDVDRSEHWERVFREKQEDEVSWFQERPASSLELIAKAAVDRRARIVDVGAGASRLAGALLDAGFEDLTVVDISAAALAKARERIGGRADRVRWIASDIRHWSPEAPFDLWHDRAMFHFMVREEDRRAYLATMRRALASGGHAVIGTFAANGPERCSGLPVQRYEPATLAAALGPDFQLVESVHEDHLTPAGNV